MSGNSGKDFYGLAVSVSARPSKGAHDGCLGCTSARTGESSAPASLAAPNAELYPNPVLNNIAFRNLPAGPVEAEITDLVGRSVLKQFLSGGELAVPALPAGQYTLRLVSQTGSSVLRFMKE